MLPINMSIFTNEIYNLCLSKRALKGRQMNSFHGYDDIEITFGINTNNS